MTHEPTPHADTALIETFSAPTFDPRLHWLNPPASWTVAGESGGLTLRSDAGTDFWQRTHYGFEADNGHLLALQATGDFVLTTRVRSRPVHQYDQAGLMVRLSPACWVKTSVEFEPHGMNRLGAVVTNGQYSDWSTQPLAKDVDTVWFRVRTEGDDCIVESSREGQHWEQIRMARLSARPETPVVLAGLYACSPKGAGHEATFSFLEFRPGRLGA